MYFIVVFNSYKFENSGYKILCTLGSYYLTSLLINAYFYFNAYTPLNHSTFKDTINNYTKLECLKGFVYGLIFFGLPNLVILESPKVTHTFLARMIGSTIFCLGFQAYGVADFMYLNDKKKFILSRLIVSKHQLFFIISFLIIFYHLFN